MPGSKQNVPVLGHSIDSAIRFVTMNACVNTTGLAAGDTLEASFDVNDGTAPVGEKDYMWSVRNSEGMPQGAGGMEETFEVPVIADGYKLTFGGNVEISPVVDGKTYTFAGYKVVKQGSSTNLLTHCKDTLATGTLSVSGSAVTGTLNSTPDGGGGSMPSMGSFDSYSCALYAIADTGFVTPVKTASAYLFGQFGPVTNPTCTIGNVASGTYKMGIRGSDTHSLLFQDVKVPKANRIGEDGFGFKFAMKTLTGGRIGIAAQALGIASGAYELALAYSKERKAFGKAISQHQAIQFKLADMATEIEAARLLCLRAAWLKDNGLDYGTASAMAKVYASRVAMWVTTEAVQIHGGYGFVKEYHVERLMRDAKITQIYEGTTEVQKIVISRALLS